MPPVPCSVRGVFVVPGPSGTLPVVLLADANGKLLPIFIGVFEAVSIKSALNHEVPPRPFTHDLFIEVFSKFGIGITSLRIDSISDGVYYAELALSKDHQEIWADCRPSDGIALALRAKAPITIEEAVLDAAGQSGENLPPLVDLEAFFRE